MEANKAASLRNTQNQTRDAVSYPEAAALTWGGPSGLALVGGKKLLSSTPLKTTVASGLNQGARAVEGAGKAVGMLERPSMIESLIAKLTKKPFVNKNAKQLTGESASPQLGGPRQPVQPTGPARLKPTQFEGEGFAMGEGEFGGSPTSQITPSGQRALPAPENIYGEGFRSMTPEEQASSGLRDRLNSLPQGPRPDFPEIYIPGPYSEVRPVQPEVPFRGRVELEPKTMGEFAKKRTPSQKGKKTESINKLLDRFQKFGLKGYED